MPETQLSRSRNPIVPLAVLIALFALSLAASCTKDKDKDEHGSPPEGASKAAVDENAGKKEGTDLEGATPGGDAAKEPEPTPPEIDRHDRLHKIQESVNAGVSAVLEDAGETLKDRCGALDHLLAPFCWEGASAAYAVSSKGTAADLEKRMEEMDPKYAFIHCQGFGFGAPQTLKGNKLRKFARALSDDCRADFWSGTGYFEAVSQLAELTKVCHGDDVKEEDCTAAGKKAVEAADLKKACKGSADATSCAYGFGHALPFIVGGDLDLATAGCKGDLDCVAGAGFVAVELFPDNVGLALDAGKALPADARAAYLHGAGLALVWRKLGDAKSLEGWLAGVPKANREEAERLLKVAEQCKATRYPGDAGCAWVADSAAAPAP